MSSSHLRLALRSLGRRPGFTAVVLATLALGIGANAAIFSVVNGILLRPLPFRDPQRVMHVTLADPYGQLSEGELMDLRRDARSFETLASFTYRDVNVTGGPEPDRVEVARVSDGFFRALGAAPAMGRAFTPDEEKPGGAPAIVVSHTFWQRYLGGVPNVVGHTLRINDRPVPIIGVMPARFDYPEPQVAGWVPLRLNPDSLGGRNNHYMEGIARLAPNASVASARAELATILPRWRRQFPETYFPGKPLAADVKPITDSIVGEARPFLLALMGAVAFVLLIACVNVASLLLTRGESRRRELAIRSALGASGGRLARQVLTEGTLLALTGGALGLLAAWGATRGLLALAPSSIPRLDEVRIDPAVLAFTLGASLATGLFAALVPAVRAAREAPADPLRESGKGVVAAAGTRRARTVLVVAEVALAVVTLAGAGLMLRSLWKIQSTDLGFSPDGVLTARVSPPVAKYDDDAAAQLWRTLAERVAAIPGVRVVGAAGNLPVANEDDSRWSILVDGRVVASVSETPSAKPVQVTPDLFRALRIPLVRGRGITPNDREDAPAVVVVNETMARQLWPGRDPLGHTIRVMGDTTAAWATVVGVVRDVRSGGFQKEVPPTFYVAHAQGKRVAYYTPRAMTLVVRATGDPAAIAPAVRATVHALAPDTPVKDVRTMTQIVAASVAGRRFTTSLLGVFAGVALALAGIGIYGVIAYLVSQRTYEIGLRMALGAQRAEVLRLVLRQGLGLTAAGLAVGVAGAAVLTRLVRSLLVDVSALDPATFAAVAVGLLGVGLAASAVPARRAMGVSPTEALRSE
jgi:predicted permease